MSHLHALALTIAECKITHDAKLLEPKLGVSTNIVAQSRLIAWKPSHRCVRRNWLKFYEWPSEITRSKPRGS